MTGNESKQDSKFVDTDDVVEESGHLPKETDSAADTETTVDETMEQITEEELLRQQLELVMQKAQDNLDLAQRTQADMENLRKRTARDIENAHKYALERFVNELLPVIDSLDLGIQASESVIDPENLKEGMHLTLKKFTDTLEKFGVVVVDPKGQKFNPDRHDAVSMADSEEYDSGIVMSVLQKGYELNGRLVRPAMVVVSK